MGNVASTDQLHSAKQRAEHQGRAAEALVAKHWEARGFEVLAHRLRTKAGELDLVVANASTLVIVEVKSRRSLDQAAHAMSTRQQMRVFQAADLALAEHEDWSRPDTRFDIALVCGETIEHIQDALRLC